MLQSLSSQFEALGFGELLIGVIGSIACNIVLRWFYIKFGQAYTNRKAMANNFIMLGAAITLIIFLIKSSIARSLGLVGALSIVRFRAAIKEPEELVFLFFCIAIGLGFGAGQGSATVVTLAITLPIYYLKYRVFSKSSTEESVFLMFRDQRENVKYETQEIFSVLEKHCKNAKIKKVDENQETVNYTFLVNIDESNTLVKLKNELREKSSTASISFINTISPVQ